jgi:hypothetical protein
MKHKHSKKPQPIKNAHRTAKRIMPNYKLPKSTEYKKGSWKPADNPDILCRVTCPGCGGTATLPFDLQKGWTANNKGEVNPSLSCDCGFHEFIELEDWNQP